MNVKKKTITFDLSITDKELKIIMTCLKGVKLDKFDDCRDWSLACDLFDEFQELFDDDKDYKDYEAEIIADVMKKPSDKAIERNKNAQELLRKLRGN